MEKGSLMVLVLILILGSYCGSFILGYFKVSPRGLRLVIYFGWVSDCQNSVRSEQLLGIAEVTAEEVARG